MVRVEKCALCSEEFFVNHTRDHWNTHPECKEYTLNQRKKQFIESNKFECKFCGRRFKSERYLTRHQIHECTNIPEEKKPLSLAQKIEQFNSESGIQCKMCEKFFRELSMHITQVHSISTEEYIAQYNEKLVSDFSHHNRSKANKINGLKGSVAIREKLKDLQYKKLYGSKISQGILDSEYAIETRKSIMARLNKTDEFRKTSSETMKETWKNHSSMNQKSHQWQKDDPEKLQETLMKGWEKSLFSFGQNGFIRSSKNEREILKLLKEKYDLKSGRFLIEKMYRFFDINVEDKILIEIDGPWHFEFFYSRFKKPQSKQMMTRLKADREKNCFALKNGFHILRISNCGLDLSHQFTVIDNFIRNIAHYKQNCIYWFGKEYRDYDWRKLLNEQIEN